jgi:hypothetical protein
MDDQAGAEAVTGRDPRLPGGAPHTGPNLGEPAALLEQTKPRGAVNGAIDAASAKKPLVRGVHDGVHVNQGGDVGADHVDRHGC